METINNPLEGTIQNQMVLELHQSYEELYQQNIILFCTLCNCFKDLSFKSKKSFNDEIESINSDIFIAGIQTPKGNVMYYIKQKYWELFEIRELERAPLCDYYGEQERLTRILSLTTDDLQKQPEETEISSTVALLEIKRHLQITQECQEQQRIEQIRSEKHK